jgi:hypothetical protein
MGYSEDQRAQAIAGASQVRTSRPVVSQALPNRTAETSAPTPIVSFLIQKKVGDAVLQVHGAAGQEKSAQKEINKAAERLRENSNDEF